MSNTAYQRAMISIHVPRERDDQPELEPNWQCRRFQSTSLVRGTTHRFKLLLGDLFISIHVPRERDDTLPRAIIEKRIKISIHVPRERDDQAGGHGPI